MKHLIFAALLLTGVAHAQTTQPPGTRVTACDPLTPNNALCLTWTLPATNSDGSTITLPLVSRVEQQLNGGAWTTAAAGLTTLRYYARNLAIGTWVFRVYESCTGSAGCAEGAPGVSNAKDSTAPVIQPGPATSVLVVQVIISLDQAPVYTVLENGSRSSTLAGMAAVGTECDGPVLFTYRGRKWRHPVVWKPWVPYISAAARVAAPCA